MDLKRLSNKAKDLVEKRGGTESLKQDADELRKIAGSKGSLGDKAKAAKEALRRPGGEPVRAEAAEDRAAAEGRAAGEDRAACQGHAAGRRFIRQAGRRLTGARSPAGTGRRRSNLVAEPP